jgi:AraC-like DNA-binding protein
VKTRREQIVSCIEETAREHPEDTLHIADLCSIVSVSPSTLYKAFRRIHGSTPYRYLRALRMSEARKALLASCADEATVTQVATRFGFLELGRFAGEYRRSFGESPSATLRRPITVFA